MQGLKSQINTLSLRLRETLRTKGGSEAGVSAVEYSLLVAFIATVIFAIVATLAPNSFQGSNMSWQVCDENPEPLNREARC